MNVLIFGDSNTQGFWDTRGGWVQRIRCQYDEQKIADRTTQVPYIFNLGISGDTSDAVLARMKSEIRTRVKEDEDFVFVCAIGINDAYREQGKYCSSPDKYGQNIRDIHEVARAFTDRILFVGITPVDEARTQPVYWDNISWNNDRIRLFDDRLRDVCAEKNTAYVSLFEAMLERQYTENLLWDGIHPNDIGHEFIAMIVKPYIDKLSK